MEFTPNFLESHISQIPAIQLLQRLGFAYLSPEEVAVELRHVRSETKGRIVLTSRNRKRFLPSKPLKVLAYDNGALLVVRNRPVTPLNDAQLGGYFFARMGR